MVLMANCSSISLATAAWLMHFIFDNLALPDEKGKLTESLSLLTGLILRGKQPSDATFTNVGTCFVTAALSNQPPVSHGK